MLLIGLKVGTVCILAASRKRIVPDKETPTSESEREGGFRRGSKYPICEASGSKSHTPNGIWDQRPKTCSPGFALI